MCVCVCGEKIIEEESVQYHTPSGVSARSLFLFCDGSGTSIGRSATEISVVVYHTHPHVFAQHNKTHRATFFSSFVSDLQYVADSLPT